MLLAPTAIQAAQGAPGNEFASADDGQGTQYITGTMGGGAPATEARVSSLLPSLEDAGVPSGPAPDEPTEAEPADAGPPPQDVDAGP